MSLLDRFKPRMIDPGARPPRPRPGDAGAGASCGAREPPDPALPRGHRAGRVRDGLLLGGRAEVLADAGVYTTAVGYAGGYTPNPTYRGGLLGQHRPHRGRAASSTTPRRSATTTLLEHVLGEPRPHPGHAPGQRHGHAVPLRRSTPRPTQQQRAAEASRDAYQEALDARRATATITTEIRPTRRLLLRRGLPPAVPGEEPRRATAASAAPASAAPSACRRRELLRQDHERDALRVRRVAGGVRGDQRRAGTPGAQALLADPRRHLDAVRSGRAALRGASARREASRLGAAVADRRSTVNVRARAGSTGQAKRLPSTRSLRSDGAGASAGGCPAGSGKDSGCGGTRELDHDVRERGVEP